MDGPRRRAVKAIPERVAKPEGGADRGPFGWWQGATFDDVPTVLPRFCLLAFGLGFLRLSAATDGPDAGEMPRVPATAPDRATETFGVRPGFRMELMAAEPLVTSPVAMSFDEAGRIYVVEMRDYSERRPEQLGRVRLLEDTDGDGKPDRSTVFLDGLPWPTAVSCWKGGVFVGATPDILYARDENGDGVADLREKVFTGFASDYAPYATNRLNVQALMNSMNWGVDGRIHGAGSMSGGTVRRVRSEFVDRWVREAGGSGTPPEIRLGGRDFAFDPRTLELSAETGGGQHGMTFDRWGGKFVCSNSDHLQWVAYDADDVPGNPFHSLPSPRLSIAEDGPSAEVFRRSPDEPWRVLRTRWRVAGIVEGPVEGGGRPSGYFTGATGVTVHRGDLAGEAAGDVFIADCGSNLIHRKRLHRDGFELRGRRVPDEKSSEFVASTDNWFRPVQFANAPDGALWVLDMYRETIEHPWSLPPGLKRRLDLDSGRDRGRLWRIVPQGTAPRRKTGEFRNAGPEELVRLLDHPNGWHRDTAARRILETGGPAAQKALSSSVLGLKTAEGRLLALGLLRRLGALGSATAVVLAKDPEPSVRAAAYRALRGLGPLPAGVFGILRPVWTLEGDPRVQWEMAWLAAGMEPRLRMEWLGPLLEAESPWIVSAAVHASRGAETELLASWDGEPVPVRRVPALLELATVAGRSGDAAMAAGVLRLLRFLPGDAVRFRTAAALSAAAGPGAGFRREAAWKEWVDLAVGAGSDPMQVPVEAIGMLPEAGAKSVQPLLALVGPAVPKERRQAAVRALGRVDSSLWSQPASEAWRRLDPEIRPELVGLMIRRPESAKSLLDAVESGRIPESDVPLAAIAVLRQSGDREVRERTVRRYGEKPASRTDAVEAFLPALGLSGDAGRGAGVFQERCASCHRLADRGVVLGPDLASVRSNGKEKILVSILDPNREVAPSFVAWTVEQKDGTTLGGIRVREDDSVLVLRVAGGAEAVLPKSGILNAVRSERSLMPEGLETGLTPQGMADLLEYVVTAR